MKDKIGLRYSKIYVIQSLPDGDQKTGEDLYYDKLLHKQFASKVITCEYFSIESKAEFISKLDHISAEVRNRGEYPIIHFELHGNQDGFRFRNGGHIRWVEFAPKLREINVLSMHNLLIVSAACEGIYLSKIIKAEERAPFWGIIGPEGIVKTKEVSEHFPMFYELFLETENADKAITYLNNIILDSKKSFRLMNSEWLFMGALNEFSNNLDSKDAVKSRAKEIVGKYQKFRTMPRAQRRIEQKRIEKQIPGYIEKQFYKYKSNFFMEDLYPENRDLFKISFEDMKKEYKGI
jgi:hypothetical protein